MDLVTSTTVQNRRQTVRELWSVSFSVDLVWLALALVALTLPGLGGRPLPAPSTAPFVTYPAFTKLNWNSANFAGKLPVTSPLCRAGRRHHEGDSPGPRTIASVQVLHLASFGAATLANGPNPIAGNERIEINLCEPHAPSDLDRSQLPFGPQLSDVARSGAKVARSSIVVQ